ncbi:MAG: galactose-1-epimerase, partial [Muribaculaceae bacterium]|nr:galactose-1-epimerase [Muribaculaceae bacterium]
MSHTLQRSTVKSPIGDIEIFTLTNKQGASVTLSSLGAGVISVRVPDREGRLDEVSLTYASPVDFIDDAPASGKTLGRYANRIAGAKFRLESRNVWLEANDGPNALNGGRNGFQNRLWQVESAGNSEVIFRRVSEDGEEGYPGR